METNPIFILVREIKDEAENAIHNFSLITPTMPQKQKRIAHDNYVNSVRKIHELSRAIETLQQNQ